MASPKYRRFICVKSLRNEGSPFGECIAQTLGVGVNLGDLANVENIEDETAWKGKLARTQDKLRGLAGESPARTPA